MSSAARYAFVIGGGLAVGGALFFLSFVGLDFVWTHFIVTDPKQIGLGDGVMVVGGGFLIGCSLGLSGLLFVLFRFWPGRTSRQSVQPGSEEAKS